MKSEYDKYYQNENLFGEPYPELIKFYSGIPERGKLLDLGCGQGRDSIALAKLGFEVTGIDNSTVGIKQLNRIAESINLPLKGMVEDIFNFTNFNEFDFILLDSMFHFGKRERTKETNFIKRVFEESSPNTLITICIQKTGKKIEILNAIISSTDHLKIIDKTELVYTFEDEKSNHKSETKYEMVTMKKVKN